MIGSHVRDLSLPWLCDIDVQLLSDLPKLQRVAFQCVSLSPSASFMNWIPPSSLTHVTIPGSAVKVFNGWVSRLSLISLEILEQDVVDFNREECQLPCTLTSLVNYDLPFDFTTIIELYHLTTFCDSHLELELPDVYYLSTFPNLTFLQCSRIRKIPEKDVLAFRSLKCLVCAESSDPKLVHRLDHVSTLERLELSESWCVFRKCMLDGNGNGNGGGGGGEEEKVADDNNNNNNKHCTGVGLDIQSRLTYLDLSDPVPPQKSFEDYRVTNNLCRECDQLWNSWPALHTLVFWSTWREDEFLQSVATLLSLTSLTIKSWSDVQPRLSYLPPLPKLTSLTLCHYAESLYNYIAATTTPCDNSDDATNLLMQGETAHLCRVCPALTSLAFPKFSPYLSLAPLVHLPHLTHLTLYDRKSAWSIPDICDIHLHPRLRQLSVSSGLHRQLSNLPDHGWTILGTRIALLVSSSSEKRKKKKSLAVSGRVGVQTIDCSC